MTVARIYVPSLDYTFEIEITKFEDSGGLRTVKKVYRDAIVIGERTYE